MLVSIWLTSASCSLEFLSISELDCGCFQCYMRICMQDYSGHLCETRSHLLDSRSRKCLLSLRVLKLDFAEDPDMGKPSMQLLLSDILNQKDKSMIMRLQSPALVDTTMHENILICNCAILTLWAVRAATGVLQWIFSGLERAHKAINLKWTSQLLKGWNIVSILVSINWGQI